EDVADLDVGRAARAEGRLDQLARGQRRGGALAGHGDRATGGQDRHRAHRGSLRETRGGGARTRRRTGRVTGVTSTPQKKGRSPPGGADGGYRARRAPGP